MNVNDPKLTAYALGEVSESERVEVENFLNQSSEARQFVSETQEFAARLRAEYGKNKATTEPRRPANLIDIRDDRWFWSIARPLAVAALITIFALLGAIILGRHNFRDGSSAKTVGPIEYAEIESEEKSDSAAELPGPNAIPNPLRADAIARAERVVIGELPRSSYGNRSEVQVIEIISDPVRISRLKNRLATESLSKKTGQSAAVPGYQLIFLDDSGHVLAAASFYNIAGVGFVLQPSRRADAVGGRYFIGNDAAVLPGEWESTVDYSNYIIPFPDWKDCVGYSPGV